MIVTHLVMFKFFAGASEVTAVGGAGTGQWHPLLGVGQWLLLAITGLMEWVNGSETRF